MKLKIYLDFVDAHNEPIRDKVFGAEMVVDFDGILIEPIQVSNHIQAFWELQTSKDAVNPLAYYFPEYALDLFSGDNRRLYCNEIAVPILDFIKANSELPSIAPLMFYPLGRHIAPHTANE
jgi:hypothetical protein